jgi:hypothetical protein
MSTFETECSVSDAPVTAEPRFRNASSFGCAAGDCARRLSGTDSRGCRQAGEPLHRPHVTGGLPPRWPTRKPHAPLRARRASLTILRTVPSSHAARQQKLSRCVRTSASQ